MEYNLKYFLRANGKYFVIKELHDNFIVVRDLKADNIIRKNGVFKIANFHYAQKLPIKDQK